MKIWQKIVKMSATKLSLSTTKTKHIKVKHPKRKLYRLIIFRVSLLYTDHFIKEFEQTFYMTVKVSFCQTVRCSSKKCAKSLSWAENLNKLFTVIGPVHLWNFPLKIALQLQFKNLEPCNFNCKKYHKFPPNGIK